MFLKEEIQHSFRVCSEPHVVPFHKRRDVNFACRFAEGKRIKGLRPQVEFAVTPVAGSCLVFDHLLLHEGSEVKSGVKYAIRTDVFYKLPG
jgi:hypothetical protein